MTDASVLAVTVAKPDGAPDDSGEDWEAAQMAEDIQVVWRYVEWNTIPSVLERKMLSANVAGLVRQHKRLCIQGRVLCCKITDSKTQELQFQIVCPASRHLRGVETASQGHKQRG